ncbi:AlpA family phage regulatory protein [Acinetobacter sp. MD2(2019)]|uniref:helix-turn-helix transcriptional regulator n=1 Tax=Acinetobacter sp. MD2(2019) TaxID=2605273 RepID=UPI002D1F9345|nr:AlpA family phage regulatory protein [Acinetobacter sp. MD2(2019)]MEB3755187.1 AlpA family phage regulatory protein [Acinetobacter sp. MD2(2019)]
MVENRYRVKELVNYPERLAKDYIDRSGRRRRVSYKPATKGLLNIAESTFWKMIRRGDFPEPVYLTASMPTWAESQINLWLNSKKADDTRAIS